MSDPEVIDTTVHKTYEWLDGVMEETSWPDRQRAYLALRAVLHAVRDGLNVDEAADLSAQLPLLVRGIYFEGWNPSGTPVNYRRREDFLDAVQRAMPAGVPVMSPSDAAQAVFRVMKQKVSQGEIEDVLGMLPRDVARILQD